MIRTHLFIFVSCVHRGMFVTPYPTLRAVQMHIQVGKSPVCQAPSLGVKEVKLETRPTDAMVDAKGAAGPVQGQCLICNINPPGDACFVKKVGLGKYCMYIFRYWDILW